FFQAEDGIRDGHVTGVQTCALPISRRRRASDDAAGAEPLQLRAPVGAAAAEERRAERRGGSRARAHLTRLVLGFARVETMKAMLARGWGEPSTLEYADVPMPRPQAGEVDIDVRAIGCAFPDILLVRGTYQHRPQFPF